MMENNKKIIEIIGVSKPEGLYADEYYNTFMFADYYRDKGTHYRDLAIYIDGEVFSHDITIFEDTVCIVKFENILGIYLVLESDLEKVFNYKGKEVK